MKILVLAGTADGRQLAQELLQRGYAVTVSVLTGYGAELAAAVGLTTRFGALDEDSLRDLLLSGGFQAVVDATHPYATNITALARNVCHNMQLPFFCWERPSTERFDHPLVHWVPDIPTAARQVARLGQRILLTTGSNSLPEWFSQPVIRDKELFVRVLPTARILGRCESLGLSPGRIIAAQGPFTVAWNKAMCEQYGIDVVVAKDSGSTGGTPQKIEACLVLNIPIVILSRPDEHHDQADIGLLGIKPKSIIEFVAHVEGQL